MKATVILLGMMVLVPPLIQADDARLPVTRFINATVEQSERSLKQGLESRSVGMQVSAAQTVRELKQLLPGEEFSSLVIPLMRIVRNEDASVASRIVAALALHDLQSERGDYAIKQVARFTGNERVKHVCSWLSYHRKRGDTATSGTQTPAAKEVLGLVPLEPVPDSDMDSRLLH